MERFHCKIRTVSFERNFRIWISILFFRQSFSAHSKGLPPLFHFAVFRSENQFYLFNNVPFFWALLKVKNLVIRWKLNGRCLKKRCALVFNSVKVILLSRFGCCVCFVVIVNDLLFSKNKLKYDGDHSDGVSGGTCSGEFQMVAVMRFILLTNQRKERRNKC